MVKKIVLIASIVLLIGLVFYIKDIENEMAEQNDEKSKTEQLRVPLYVEKREVEAQIEQLIKDFENSKQHKGTTQLLFTECDKQVYEACYPIMKKYGFPGVLAFSQTEYPGAEGCMSVEQFQELMQNGWTVCATWDTASAPEEWLPVLEQKAQEMGAEVGQTMYFPAGTYNLTLDAKVQELGFSIVVCNETDTETIVRTEEEDGVWHLGAVGFMSEKPKIWLTEAVAQKGNITYLVGFELEHEKYTETPFMSMLSYFEAYQDSNELLVTQTEVAREHYRNRMVEQSQTLQQEFEQKKAELEKKLADIEAQINALNQ